MSSSASLKDLCKAISAFIHDPYLPLPGTLLHVIDGYLAKHQKYDDANADRLQDELFLIFNKNVKPYPNTFASWFSILRRLYPVLYTQERLLQWFEACEGFLDRAPVDKALADETSAAILDVVPLLEKQEEEQGNQNSSCPVLDRLLSLWINRFYPNSLKGAGDDAEPNEKLIRDGLVQFGRKRPREFFASIDLYLVQSRHRTATLRIFCDYVQSRPPHLHKILDSTLFSNLLTCLQLDSSTTTLSAALTALIMLLPHMPSSVVPHLPVLFNIYARLLFWRQERSGVSIPPINVSNTAKPWEACAFDADTEDMSIAHLDGYYTILYGLYPINFMDYIRKPQRYLRHCNIPNADEVDIQPTELRHHSEKFRQLHVLHPNFYSLTIESEKVDFGRWIKSEAADVAAECMALSLAPSENVGLYLSAPEVLENNSADEPALAPENVDGALLSTSLDQDEPHGLGLVPAIGVEPASTPGSGTETNGAPEEDGVADDATLSPQMPPTEARLGGQDGEGLDMPLQQSTISSPPLGTNLGRTPSQTRLQNLIRSSSPKLSCAQPEISSPTSTNSNAQIAHLQRQVLLLQNDLSFERYQKQQHMAHIGDLRRRLVSEAASEAETQNLILTNRGLKTRFEEAKKAEIQIRKEAEKSRTMAKKRENDVSSRLQRLRDDSKQMQSELASLRSQLEEAHIDNERLKTLISKSEVRQLKLEQDMKWSEIQVNELDRLKAELDRLMLVEREAQGREQHTQQALIDAQAADARSQSLRLELAAARSDHQRTIETYEAQASVLREELQAALEVKRGRPANESSVSGAVQKSLEASRAKISSIQEAYSRLSKKYTACQNELFELQSRRYAEPQKMEIASSPDSTDGPSYLSLSPGSLRRNSRPQRILSETNMSEMSSLSHHAPRPLGSITDETGHARDQTSPERSFLRRGSSQIHLQSKAKPRDESPAGGSAQARKEKKSRLRGIRGLG